MKLGRDFTNLLNTSFLSEKEKVQLKAGEIAVADMDARVQIKAKADIVNQIKVAKETGLDHVELDGGIPNPYLDLPDNYLAQAKKAARDAGITLSFHLPYTFVCAATSCFQESDRMAAVNMMKQYLDVAAKLGCIYANMHPGVLPYYQTVGEYLNIMKEKTLKSLLEIEAYSKKNGIGLHMENNTVYDSIMVEVPDCLEMLRLAKEKGADIKYCFDIGHWFTREDGNPSKPVPLPPENIMEEIPADLYMQLHLNDYIPVKRVFHPPLNRETGLLKRENLINYFKIAKKKGATLVVVETAVRAVDDLLSARQLMLDENKFIKGVMKEAGCA